MATVGEECVIGQKTASRSGIPRASLIYGLGLFQTASGPLCMNAGIGCFHLNVRFNCRPEITVFEI